MQFIITVVINRKMFHQYQLDYLISSLNANSNITMKSDPYNAVTKNSEVYNQSKTSLMKYCYDKTT
jgi:hypothetical protein